MTIRVGECYNLSLCFFLFPMFQVSSVAPESVKIPTEIITQPSVTFAPPLQQKNTVMSSESASDFNEDPFKNYRYEDPFMISDPFQDEEPPADIFKGRNFVFLSFSFNHKIFPEIAEKFENTSGAFDKFAFEDNADPFISEKLTSHTNGNDGNNNKFDPFGAPLTTDKKNETKIKDFGFEGDFANFDSFDDNATTNGNSKTIDAWGGRLDKVNNNAGKQKKFKEQEVNNSDYSKNFDEDLEQVLKRSVMEQ